MRYRNAGRTRLRAEHLRRPAGRPGARSSRRWWVEAAEIGRYAYELHADDDDFGQPGTLVRDVMDETDRDHLVGNIVAHASATASSDDVQRRVIDYWTNVDADLGARVAAGLGHGNGRGNTAAGDASISGSETRR